MVTTTVRTTRFRPVEGCGFAGTVAELVEDVLIPHRLVYEAELRGLDLDPHEYDELIADAVWQAQNNDCDVEQAVRLALDGWRG